MQNADPQGDRRCSMLAGGERPDSTPSPANAQQREPFRVVISRGIWRGCDVLIEPPTIEHRLRHFRDHDEAVTFAEELGRVTGWPITDRANDG